MMSNRDMPFYFGRPEGIVQQGDKVVRLPCNIDDRTQLFDAYAQYLALPDYFGKNWDAFSECLRDLTWVVERRIVIIHEDLPVFDGATLRIYLEVLADCIDDWQPDEDHELLVLFPEAAEQSVVRCLSG
jgi:RNAse (barnase) inhibitor barstar